MYSYLVQMCHSLFHGKLIPPYCRKRFQMQFWRRGIEELD